MSALPILVVGSANMDLVFRCPRFPAPGETLLGGEFAMHPGGKGANQAVAAGKLGGDIRFLGRLGIDSFAQDLRQSLVEGGVEVSLVSTDPVAATGTAVILVDASTGQNEIVVASGSNMMLSSSEVEKAVHGFPGIVLSQLEIPMPAIEAAGESSRFILNPAPACPLSDELLARVDVITPNETETEMLTGIAPVDMAACRAASEWFFSRGVGRTVITLGKRGAYVNDRSSDRVVPAPVVTPVDTTAAGDALNGALAVFLSRGDDLFDAVAKAVAYASLSTTRAGAISGMPTADEFGAFWDVNRATV